LQHARAIRGNVTALDGLDNAADGVEVVIGAGGAQLGDFGA